MKVATIRLESIKEPDAFQELARKLGIDDEKSRRFFEFGEYADIQLVVNEDMVIVGGCFLPRSS